MSMFPEVGEEPDLSPCRKFLTPEDETSVFTMDHFPLWYRQAAEQPAGSFVFNLRLAEGPGNPYPVLLGRVEPGLPSSSALRARSRQSRSPSSLLPPPDTGQRLEKAYCGGTMWLVSTLHIPVSGPQYSLASSQSWRLKIRRTKKKI